jgi:hypothetical protein
MLELEALLDGVERARADVAVDDANGEKRELRDSVSAGSRLGFRDSGVIYFDWCFSQS